MASFGGVSLRHGRQPDWKALRQARQLVLGGCFPFAVAPEGATNGHSERIGPLEPGVAQLALWCVDDLHQAGRSEEVLLLPIALQYSYSRADWPRLATLMASLEASIGLAAPEQKTPPIPAAGEVGGPRTGEAAAVDEPYGRLLRISEAFLDRLERFFGNTPALPFPRDWLDPAGSQALRPLPAQQQVGVYQVREPSASIEPLPPSQPCERFGPAVQSEPPALACRLERLVERCLLLAEGHFHCPSTGTTAQRCRRLEEQSWRWIYREDLQPRPQLSRLERALADRAAHGAALALLPMRLAETLVAVSGSYGAERPSFERYTVTTLLIHDALARIYAEGLPARPRLGARRARISIGSPISVTECRRGRGEGERRQLLVELSEALRRSFKQALI